MSRTPLFPALLIVLGAIIACAGGGDEEWFLHGYTDRLSYRAGDEISFHVSTNLPSYDIAIHRLGQERREVFRRAGIRGVAQPVPADASESGCGWETSFTLTVPGDWESGYYEAYTGANHPDRPGEWFDGHTPFFVIRAAEPGRKSPILLQLATNTYNAYNNWGGRSLYGFNSRDGRPARRVSFQRPIPSDAYSWELPFIRWAESNGYRLEYAVNADLEFHPEILAAYHLVLSVGHDEYWSAPMRDHLEAFLDAGGNAAFLGGNAVAWQVRFEDGGRTMVGYKQAFRDDPLYSRGGPNPLLTTLWSHPLVGRPENLLTGVGFQFGGFHRSHGEVMDGTGAYTVHRAAHWVFEGTGLSDGDAFGGDDTIVGYECDGCEYRMRDGVPEPTHRDGTPESFIILATSPARWPDDEVEWYEGWDRNRRGGATMGLHTRPGGGTVFTAATTDWAHGLEGADPSVERITRNVLDRLSGRAVPATRESVD